MELFKSISCTLSHGRPQTFFQGRAKIFPGGARTYFLPKKMKKILIFPKKSENILFLVLADRQEPTPCPPLWTPMFKAFIS
jgi:hypothetical protein